MRYTLSPWKPAFNRFDFFCSQFRVWPIGGIYWVLRPGLKREVLRGIAQKDAVSLAKLPSAYYRNAAFAEVD
jgi:hypothetical protein